MADEQDRLVRGFSRFLSKLARFDKKVGVVTTYLSGDTEKDKKVRTGNFNYILSDIQRNETLTTDRLERYKYGDEKGIDRVLEVIKNNSGFIRQDAELAVIFVSDEDSGCRVADYDATWSCTEYFDDHKTADDLINGIKNKFGHSKIFTAHSIVDTGGANCPRSVTDDTANPSIGKLYMDTSEKTGGHVSCIYSGSYDKILNSIAEDIKVQSVQLACAPYENKEEDKCFVLTLPNNYRTNADYPYLDGSKLVFSPPLQSDQVVSVEYWCGNYQHGSEPDDLTVPCS